MSFDEWYASFFPDGWWVGCRNDLRTLWQQLKDKGLNDADIHNTFTVVATAIVLQYGE